MGNNVIELNEKTFEAAVKGESKVPVLVDFWAPWCAPCKATAPVIENIAGEFSEKIKVCKVNIDDNHKIASEFGIMSIPTIIIYKNGIEKERIVGALGQRELTIRIEKHLE